MATPDRTGSKGDVVQSRSRLQSATVVVPSMDFNLELADEYAMEELGMGAGNGEPEPATAPSSKALRFAQVRSAPKFMRSLAVANVADTQGR